MKLSIKEREEQKLSPNSSMETPKVWEVYQGDLLIGIYLSENEAQAYKALIESKNFAHKPTS